MPLLFLLNRCVHLPLTGHWVMVQNAHLLRPVVQLGEHGDLSLIALTQHTSLDPAGYTLRRAD